MLQPPPNRRVKLAGVQSCVPAPALRCSTLVASCVRPQRSVCISLQMISGMVGEIILCIKERNQQTRAAAFELLVQVREGATLSFELPSPTSEGAAKHLCDVRTALASPASDRARNAQGLRATS